MKAKYNGNCAWCSNPIYIGDDIHKVADCWIHQDCEIMRQPNPLEDIGRCCTCNEERLLVIKWGNDRYCRICWYDIAERMEEDWGHIHDIWVYPFRGEGGG